MATQDLKDVVDQVGRFDGKNISIFLRTYTSEMKLHLVVEAQMMKSFELALVLEI